MKEKERYKLESYHEAFCEIHDTKSDEWYLRKDLITDLLNQQDTRIKELEQESYPAYKREHQRRAYLENIEVPKLKERIKELEEELRIIQYYKTETNKLDYELRKENEQLKIENGTLKEKISIQLQLNADNVNFMENQRRENEQLKQQLAEQEKETATLEVMLAENKNELKELQEFKVGDDAYDLTDRDARFSLQCDLLNTEQDKISFAIKQLEKVKEEMDLRPRGVSKGWKNKEYDTLVEEDVYEVIDNQIKELEEKNNGR